MPKEAINLDLLLSRILNGEIRMDKPLLILQDDNHLTFPIFQDSGLNILLGNEGHGKTKFLTRFIYQFLDMMEEEDLRFKNFRILYIDTERPESQYANSINHIFEKANFPPNEILKRLEFISTIDLTSAEMKQALQEHLEKNKDIKYVIIIDHILPFVNDMNSINEASDIDIFLKKLISAGHLIIVSTHKPSSGYLKGLGHIGSTLQRLASFILEISNNTEGDGFQVKQIKSRVSARTNNILHLTKDEFGNIDSSRSYTIKESERKDEREQKQELAKEILKDFINKELTTKKQLFEIIQTRASISKKSSSVYKFYDDFLKDYILFENTEFSLTDLGKKIIDNE